MASHNDFNYIINALSLNPDKEPIISALNSVVSNNECSPELEISYALNINKDLINKLKSDDNAELRVAARKVDKIIKSYTL